MKKSFCRVVDSMPFLGKFMLSETLRHYVRSSPNKEASAYLSATGVLALYICGHAYQAKLGVDTFSSHLRSFEAEGSPMDIALMGLDATYTATMTSVTVRQAELVRRLRTMRRRRLERREKQPVSSHITAENDARVDIVVERPSPIDVGSRSGDRGRGLRKKKWGAVGVATVVTLGGQGVFCASMFDGIDKSAEIECIDVASGFVREFDEIFPLGTEPVQRAQYITGWADYCGVEGHRVLALVGSSTPTQ